MYPAILILKVACAALFLYRVYVLVKFRKADKTMRFTFDLLSSLELDAGLALTVIGLLANPSKAGGFTAGILVLALLLNGSQLKRIVLAGDRKILIGVQIFDLNGIKGMNASRMTLHVFVKGGKKINVVIPLTRNETIRKMKYIRN